uniref:Minor structural protein n=1 Tax=Dulem virus 39 TaxID=3145757 RepID=A0AAU8B5N1_9CAUD
MYINTSESFNDSIGKFGGRTFRARLVSDEYTIEDEIKKISYIGGSNGDDEITVGSSTSAYAEVTIQKINRVLAGTEFRFEIGIMTEDGIEYCPMGLFTAEKPTEEGNESKFKAYDRMAQLELPYASKLQYPCTTIEIMEEISEITGYPFATNLEPITLNNPNTGEESSNTVMAGYTLRETVGYISGLYGKFAVFNRSGELEFHWYEDSEYILPAKKCWKLKRGETDFSIDKIVGISPSDEQFTSGSGESGFYYSNPFINQDILDEIYNSIGGFSYRSAEIKFLGDCRIEPWEIISVQDITGNVYKVPAMQIKHNLDGGLATTIIAKAKESEGESDKYKGPITKAMERTHAELLIVNFLLAQKASFDYVEANYIQTKELAAISAYIETAVLNSVRAEFATIKQLDAESARIDDLETNSLTASSAIIQELLSGVADINTLIFGSATGTTIQTEFANAVIAQLGNAQIKSAMIKEVAANKITGLDINTSKLTVHSEDGKSIWSDNTIQISDGTRIRVQIGKDASNDYSINIWDEEGKLMFSEGGITDNAIKTAIIRNEMVSENANISASKLDIESLFDEINNDGSHTLNSSKIYLDSEGQTLDISFLKIKSDTEGVEGELSEVKETITTQGTQISAIQGQISSKVWQQDIATATENIKIGGTQILRGTNSADELTGTSNAAWNKGAWRAASSGNGERTSITISDSPNANIKRGWSLTRTSGALDIAQDNIPVSLGQLYTISCYARWVNGTPKLRFQSYAASETAHFQSYDITEEEKEWKQYSFVFTHDFTESPSRVSIYFGNSGDGTIEICGMKLETGNKATDWTPSPEDLDGDITSLNTKYSEINQSVDRITATVGEHTTELNGLETRVTYAEASIEVTAEEISTKVSKDGVISAINQSAEEIEIQANKINLNGVVTANESFKINEDGSMEAIAGELGGWKIEGDSISKTVQMFVYPSEEDIDNIKELMISGDWTEEQLAWYDYDSSGDLDILDINHIRRMLLGIETVEELVYKYGYIKPLFDVKISLSATDYQRTLKMESFAYGRQVVRYYGISDMETSRAKFGGVNTRELFSQNAEITELTCGSLKVEGDQDIFSLNNSSYDFDMSKYSGHVYDIVVYGDYGCAYASVIRSPATLSVAINGNSWTGAGSIKLQQTGSAIISFVYSGTYSMSFYSKIVEKY